MATKKKMLEAAAGGAGGAGLDITDVFSTYLYDGTGQALAINNGIDLDGEGGLVWGKSRTDNGVHSLYDTERGVQKPLFSNATNAQGDDSGGGSTNGLYQFNSNGFNLGADWAGNINVSGQDMVSWTFRKAEKFFDIVTYTGNSTENRKISHNLGCEVGMIFVKRTSSAQKWVVYHRGNTAAPETEVLYLNLTDATSDLGSAWHDTAPTSTEFTLGDQVGVNKNGETYVAYLFAHNDDDGGFGPDGDQDIIKCGSYTGNGSTDGPVIDLGFEPQWVLIKAATRPGGENWVIYDNMRGISTGGGDPALFPNDPAAEDYGGSADNSLDLLPNGFKITSASGRVNDSYTYIYMAIRRGPLAPPEAGTEVFAIDSESTTAPTPPSYNTGFAVDMFLSRRNVTTSGSWYLYDRLRKSDVGLIPDATNAELASGGAYSTNDRNDGIGSYTGTVYSNKAYGWMWKRAPSFFDVVAYSGNSSTNTLNHSLGVAPEMIIYKARNGAVSWRVHANITGSGYDRLVLDSSSSKIDTEVYGSGKELASQPSATELVLGSGSGTNNSSSFNYIAYLFASLDGVSKVGSYTGTGGTPQNIDCGFTSGARFVLIKKSSGTGDWWVFDTARGIVPGNDPALNLNTTDAEDNSYDMIDPYSAGFTVTDAGYDMNESGSTYIFYAIA